jgi:hypothetical protein
MPNKLYTPPDGTYDQPFTYVFDATALVDGQDALNQRIDMIPGIGDFILRRIVGVTRVVNTTSPNGQWRYRDAVGNYHQSVPENAAACTDYPVVPELFFPDTSEIGIDLYDVLREAADPVTNAPVVIDLNGFETGNSDFHQTRDNLSNNSFRGTAAAPIEMISFGGALWAFLSSIRFTDTARAFKSIDGGDTWVPQDTANEPGLLPVSGLTGDPHFFYPIQGGPTVYVAWQTNTGVGINVAARINSFDMSTGLWGTQSILGTNNLTGRRDTYLVRLSTGDFYLISGDFPSATNAQYVTFIGGVWAVSATAVNSPQVGMSTFGRSAAVDSTDTIHYVYEEVGPTANQVTLFYVQISSLGVVGTPIQLGQFTAAFRGWNVGNIVFWNNQIIIPYQNNTDDITAIFVGTPLATPTFTSTTVEAAPVGARAFWPTALVDKNNSLVIIWYLAGASDNTLRISINTGSGFTPSELFYDENTNPPANLNTPGALAVSSIVQLSNGTYSILWDADVNSPTIGVLSPAFFLGGSSAVKTSQLAFQGVRRQYGRRDPFQASYCFRPKTYTYTPSVKITAVAFDSNLSPALPVTLIQRIDDYDFELHQIMFHYVSAAGVPQNPAKVFANVDIFDWVHNKISNIPMVDQFINGAPDSFYRNGAFVPPLLYPRDSQLQIDFYSQVIMAGLLPLTCKVTLIGIQRIPA